MEIEDENEVDVNSNEMDIEISDEESEADQIMPIRKSQDPRPVCTSADRMIKIC